tara:strand:- start:556 stop:1296 length:741 start_codon:yes stop_codon:yes gene_type:complete
MIVTPFGSCRIEDIAHSSNLSNEISYTHCTKEIIQLIKYINGDIKLENYYDRFCMRKSIINKESMKYDPSFKERFDKTNVFVLEITSMKKYMYKDKYFSHMAVDRRLFDKDYKNTPEDIFNETNVILQTDEEIENDILEIQKLVFPRPIIVISHINVTYKGKKLHKRDYLITLLEKICKKNKIMFINPTNLLTQFEQSDIMEPDLGHINTITKHILYNHINLCTSYIFQKGDFYKRDPILLHQSII